MLFTPTFQAFATEQEESLVSSDQKKLFWQLFEVDSELVALCPQHCYIGL